MSDKDVEAVREFIYAIDPRSALASDRKAVVALARIEARLAALDYLTSALENAPMERVSSFLVRWNMLLSNEFDRSMGHIRTALAQARATGKGAAGETGG